MTAGGGRTRDTLREMQTLRPLGQGEANENKGITNYKINLGSQNFIFFFFFFFFVFCLFFFWWGASRKLSYKRGLARFLVSFYFSSTKNTSSFSKISEKTFI